MSSGFSFLQIHLAFPLGKAKATTSNLVWTHLNGHVVLKAGEFTCAKADQIFKPEGAGSTISLGNGIVVNDVTIDANTSIDVIRGMIHKDFRDAAKTSVVWSNNAWVITNLAQ